MFKSYTVGVDGGGTVMFKTVVVSTGYESLAMLFNKIIKKSLVLDERIRKRF